MQNDFWFSVIWWSRIASILVSKVLDKDWSFSVAFFTVFALVLIYKRYSERRHK